MEDVHSNPLFEALINNYHNYYEKLFQETGWMLCLPKADTTTTKRINETFVKRHVLKPPIAVNHENSKFLDLEDTQVEVTDVTVRVLSGQRTVQSSLLYTETYYDDDFRSFLVLHIDSDLSSGREANKFAGSGKGSKMEKKSFSVPIERRTRKEHELCLKAALSPKAWRGVESFLSEFCSQFKQGLVDSKRVEMKHVARAISNAVNHVLSLTRLTTEDTDNTELVLIASVQGYLLDYIYAVVVEHCAKIPGHKEANETIDSVLEYVASLDMDVLKIRKSIQCDPKAAVTILKEITNARSPAGKLACIQDSFWMLTRCIDLKYERTIHKVPLVKLRFKRKPFGIIVAQTSDGKRTPKPGPIRCTRRRSVEVMRNVYFKRFHGEQLCPMMRSLRSDVFDKAIDHEFNAILPEPGWRLIDVNGKPVRGLHQDQLLDIVRAAELPATLTFYAKVHSHSNAANKQAAKSTSTAEEEKEKGATKTTKTSLDKAERVTELRDAEVELDEGTVASLRRENLRADTMVGNTGKSFQSETLEIAATIKLDKRKLLKQKEASFSKRDLVASPSQSKSLSESKNVKVSCTPVCTPKVSRFTVANPRKISSTGKTNSENQNFPEFSVNLEEASFEEDGAGRHPTSPAFTPTTSPSSQGRHNEHSNLEKRSVAATLGVQSCNSSFTVATRSKKRAEPDDNHLHPTSSTVSSPSKQERRRRRGSRNWSIASDVDETAIDLEEKPVLTADDELLYFIYLLAHARPKHLYTDLQLILNLTPNFPPTDPPLAHTAASLHAAVEFIMSGRLPTPSQQKLLHFLLSASPDSLDDGVEDLHASSEIYLKSARKGSRPNSSPLLSQSPHTPEISSRSDSQVLYSHEMPSSKDCAKSTSGSPLPATSTDQSETKTGRHSEDIDRPAQVQRSERRNTTGSISFKSSSSRSMSVRQIKDSRRHSAVHSASTTQLDRLSTEVDPLGAATRLARLRSSRGSRNSTKKTRSRSSQGHRSFDNAEQKETNHSHSPQSDVSSSYNSILSTVK